MAASSARFLPVDTPTPSMAVPELHMMAFTSAKSTLTRPGMVMMSEMPCTPCARARGPSVRRARAAPVHGWHAAVSLCVIAAC